MPIGEMGVRLGAELTLDAEPMLAERRRFQTRFRDAAPPRRLHFAVDGVVVDDWLDGLQTDGALDAWIRVRPSTFADKDGVQPIADKLIDAWVRILVSSACGCAAPGLFVGRDVTLRLGVLDRESADRALRHLLVAWRRGMNEPLPLPSRTAIAFASGENADAVYDGGFEREGERAEPCLRRRFSNFAALCADGSFETLATQIYRPMLDWIAASVDVVPRECDAAEEPADV